MAFFRKNPSCADAIGQKNLLDRQPSLTQSEFTYVEALDHADAEAAFMGCRNDEAIECVRRNQTSLRGDLATPLVPHTLGPHKHGVVDYAHTTVAVVVDHSPPAPTVEYEGPRLDAFARVSFIWAHGRICGIDLNPNGSSVFVTEYCHGTGALCELDLTSGRRRFISSLGRTFGSEIPQISADGRRCIVNTHPHPTIIDVATGNCFQVALPDAHIAWWSGRGAASVLVVSTVSGRPALGHLDLENGRYESEGELELPPEAADLPVDRLLMSEPRVSPDGRRALLGTTIGPPADFQQRNGSRDHLAIVDLQTRQLRLVTTAFADSTRLVQRVHSSWKWTRPASGANEATFTIHESFDSSVANTDPAPQAPSRAHTDQTLVVWR